MSILQRLVDQLRHPGESPVMREYRRYRNATGRDNRLPQMAVRVGGPWPEMAHRIRDNAEHPRAVWDGRERRMRLGTTEELITGVTLDAESRYGG